MNLKNKIIIEDDFFSSEILNLIHYDLSVCKFTNRYTEKNNTVAQKIYFNVSLSTEHFAVKETKNKINKIGIKIQDMDSYYFLSAKHKDATPHNDLPHDINCLIYLQGNYLINSGTGFYDIIDNKYVLNTHVGFKENRAIIFDSGLAHASLQFNENCGKRFAMTNFINMKN